VQNSSHDTSRTDLTFTVPKADVAEAQRLMEVVAKELEADSVRSETSISKVSVVGVGMRSHSGVAARMFQVLSQAGINIQMIAPSEIKNSVVIDEVYTELAVRLLHQAFGLDQA
jgi:aspartate kinase